MRPLKEKVSITLDGDVVEEVKRLAEEENPDFPLCPYGFWRFCYHSVITVIVYCPSRITILNFLLHNI